jgi:hypothetical protein
MSKPFFNSVWGQGFGANSDGKASFYAMDVTDRNLAARS